MKPTMKSQILRMLADGQWHGCNDLLPYGLSYRNRLSEMAQKGYGIYSRK